MKNTVDFYKFFVVVLFTAFCIGAKGQAGSQSPYSRYGLGDISAKGLAQNFAMGGTSIAMQNDSAPILFINPANPASYSNMKLTTAELGMNLSQLNLESSTASNKVNNASFSYFTIAFPLKKWWGASAGLMPYSSVGYNTSSQENINNIGNVDFKYEGTGGINQVYFGNGIKPFYGLPKLFLNSKRHQRLIDDKKYSSIAKITNRKKALQSLSLGINASYLFGTISNVQHSIFPFSSYAFNTRTGVNTRVNNISVDCGTQYAFTFDSLNGRDLKENVQLLLGATYAPQINLNATTDTFAYSYFINSFGRETIRDTIKNTGETKGKITLPYSLGFGMAFKKGDKWLIASDFSMQNWSNLSIFNNQQSLNNSMRIAIGTQYVPNAKATGKGAYPKRIHYRLGARYLQTGIEVKNAAINEQAISVGVGLPVGRNYLLQNYSMINLGLEIGQRGSTSNGLVKEQFIKAVIGFTINDKWFIKPKFD